MPVKRRIQEKVRPEVRETWPTEGIDSEILLADAREKIDALNIRFHQTLVSLLKLWVGFYVLVSETKSWVRMLSGVVRDSVRHKCNALKIDPAETSLYYLPVFDGVVSNFGKLLSKEEANTELLLRGLPSRERELRFSKALSSGLVRRRIIQDWYQEYDALLEVLSERISVVKVVLIAKGPDAEIHVPSREEENRDSERERCDKEGIDPEIRETFYVATLQDLMDASSNFQRFGRSNTEAFREILKATQTLFLSREIQ